MYKQKIRFLVGFFAALYANIWAPITELKQFAGIMQHAHKMVPGAVVIYDIDNTLIEPKDELEGSDQWRLYYEKQLKAEDPHNYLERAYAEYYARQFRNIVREVEAGIAEHVEAIRALQIPAIAITNRSTVLKMRTVEQLASVGIDFDDETPDFEFEVNDKKSGERYPVTFHKGIMHTRGCGKGKALHEYTQRTGRRPTLVIMVDDGKYNLEDMEKYCQEHGVEYIGLHYTYLAEKVASFAARYK